MLVLDSMDMCIVLEHALCLLYINIHIHYPVYILLLIFAVESSTIFEHLGMDDNSFPSNDEGDAGFVSVSMTCMQH